MLKPSITKYEYSVLDYSVTDADTIATLLDLGFNVFHQSACRLHGIDGPERNTTAGKLVAQVNYYWLKNHGPSGLLVTSMERDKYADRYVGRIKTASLTPTIRCLNEFLLFYKLVKPYDGKTKSPWTAEELDEVERVAVNLLWDVFSTLTLHVTKHKPVRFPNAA